jgi:hypothetical protein
MSMTIRAWCLRITEQVPGWHPWFQTGGRGTGWYAVPATADTPHTEAVGLPNRIGPYRRPQDLRTACRANGAGTKPQGSTH